MTNEELLQQAKEQIAKNNGFKNWDGLKDYCYELTGCGQLINYAEEAAELAIQSAREEAAPKWIPVTESLPKKPGLKSYEHVPCNVYVPQWGVLMLMWNCEHECWDDESGDDVSSYNSSVTHWMHAPEEPKLTAPGR